jgi:hypothetical protein
VWERRERAEIVQITQKIDRERRWEMLRRGSRGRGEGVTEFLYLKWQWRINMNPIPLVVTKKISPLERRGGERARVSGGERARGRRS